jgi:hypothetical protein
MKTTNRNEFVQLFTRLRVAYPLLRNMPAEEWTATIETYHYALRNYSPQLLAEVFAAAVKHWTDFFPTAGQLQAAALALYRRKLEGAPVQKQLPQGPGPRPDTGENPTSRLAAQWYDDSRNRGLDPDSDTPPEVAAERFKQFWDAWDETRAAIDNKEKEKTK